MSKKLWQVLEYDPEIRDEFNNGLGDETNCYLYASGNYFHELEQFDFDNLAPLWESGHQELKLRGLNFVSNDREIPTQIPQNHYLIVCLFYDDRNCHFIRSHSDGTFTEKEGWDDPCKTVSQKSLIKQVKSNDFAGWYSMSYDHSESISIPKIAHKLSNAPELKTILGTDLVASLADVHKMEVDIKNNFQNVDKTLKDFKEMSDYIKYLSISNFEYQEIRKIYEMYSNKVKPKSVLR